jgi:hypothetical protein
MVLPDVAFGLVALIHSHEFNISPMQKTVPMLMMDVGEAKAVMADLRADAVLHVRTHFANVCSEAAGHGTQLVSMLQHGMPCSVRLCWRHLHT